MYNLDKIQVKFANDRLIICNYISDDKDITALESNEILSRRMERGCTTVGSLSIYYLIRK